ncbi:unnamed protein product, partial [Polarella glacialis]
SNQSHTPFQVAAQRLHCDALLRVYDLSCQPNVFAPGCNLLVSAYNCSEKSTLGSLAQAVAGIIATRASQIDKDVLDITDGALVALWRNASSEVLAHTAVLVDSLNCNFIRQTIDDIVDGACHQLIVGLLEVRDALNLLGSLCIMLSAIMYILWLNTEQYLAKARLHRKADLQATRGGTPFDHSAVSRHLAIGSSDGSPSSTWRSANCSPEISGKCFVLNAARRSKDSPGMATFSKRSAASSSSNQVREPIQLDFDQAETAIQTNPSIKARKCVAGTCNLVERRGFGWGVADPAEGEFRCYVCASCISL